MRRKLTLSSETKENIARRPDVALAEARRAAQAVDLGRFSISRLPDHPDYGPMLGITCGKTLRAAPCPPPDADGNVIIHREDLFEYFYSEIDYARERSG